jgi:imidazolonepropionase-like amidohydrolase
MNIKLSQWFTRVIILLMFISTLAACQGMSLADTPGSAVQGQATPATALAFVDVTVIDATGAPPQPNMTVVITGDRITALGATGTIELPAQARVIQAQGKYLIPGLWDMHVHLLDPGGSFLPLLVTHGVTGVRDVGLEMASIQRFRQDIHNGKLIGPRIKAAGAMIVNPSAWNALQQHASPEHLQKEARRRIVVATPDEARQAVREIANSGADFIKLHDNHSRDTFFAVVDEAHRVGIPLIGHDNQTGLTVREMSDAGFRSLEHFDAFPGQLDTLDAAARQELYAHFVRNDTAFVPTLVTFVNFKKLYPTPNVDVDARMKLALADDRAKYISPSVQEEWRFLLTLIPEWPPVQLEAAGKYLAEMHRAGVRIMPGTDVGAPVAFPGSSLHEELQQFVTRVGMTPHEALQSATRYPAEYFGMQETLGTIETGKIADLVLLDANPLDDISNTQKINAVVVNGRLLDRAMLDNLLTQAEALASQ